MNKEICFLRLLFVLYAVCLTALFGGSAYWNIDVENTSIVKYAGIAAEASIDKDLLYRRWNAMHGGVYVPITDQTPSNPYLSFVPDRDVVTTNGKQLTLINPAYMTRQVFEIAEEFNGSKGHITSLNPLRPENAADKWETEALELFETGLTEFHSLDTINGAAYLRYMRALKVENSCLKCHGDQGYKLGEVRGGVSVAIPIASYDKIASFTKHPFITSHIVLYTILLLLGGVVFRFMLIRLKKLASMHREVLEREIQLKEQNSQFLKLNKEYKNQNTELIKAYEIAESRDKEYRDVVETTSNLITVVDNTGIFLFVNHASSYFFGLLPEECIGLPAFDFVHPDDHASTNQMFDKLLQSKVKRFSFENRQVTIAGKIIDVAWNINIDIENDKVMKITSVGRDVTKQKEADRLILKAKEEAEKNERLLNITGELAKVGGWEIDVVNQKLIWSKVVYSIHEVEDDYMPNIADAINFYDDESKPIIQQAVNDAVETGTPFDVELGIITQKGNHKRVKAIGFVEKDSDGNLSSILGVFQDITEQSLLFDESLRAKEKAEESDRLKTAFLQNMSHEIRTPMNAIMGFSSLLAQNLENPSKLETFVSIINQRSNDLLDIINDILDISKIESGQLTLNIDECNIYELFDELSGFFEGYRVRLEKRHLNFKLKCLVDKSRSVVNTDSVKLKQILINLIGNAFKYTNNGSIECTCELFNNQLLFRIADTGIGIPKEKQNTIFDRFTQIRNNETSTIGGTGLGLSIAKGLIHLLGGRIWFDSEIGKGTDFYFSIDYTQASKELAEVDVSETVNYTNFSGKTVLIVEDDFFNAEYLREILLKADFNIISTDLGAKAVQIAKTEKLDIILMDVRLPDISGYEATKKILEIDDKIMIIAQTAYAAQDEKNNAMLAGCIDYISKPIQSEQLLELINKHLMKE